jgi:hypothetical protein
LTNFVKELSPFIEKIAGGSKAVFIFFGIYCLHIDPANDFIKTSFLPEVSEAKERG